MSLWNVYFCVIIVQNLFQYSCCTSDFSVCSLPWCLWSFLFNLLLIVSCIHRPYFKPIGIPRGLWRSSDMNLQGRLCRARVSNLWPTICNAACDHFYKLYIYTTQSRWLAYHILWFLHATRKQVHDNVCGPLPKKSGHPSCTASHKLAQYLPDSLF